MALKKSTRPIVRECVGCGVEIPPIRRVNGAKFCSKVCRSRHYTTNVLGLKPSGLPTGTVGAVSELVASCDLLARGVETFRALSPSCSCDLIARFGDGRMLRIEVRSGYRSAAGDVTFPLGPRDEGRSDVIAVVIGREVFYYPDLFGEGDFPATPHLSEKLRSHYG